MKSAEEVMEILEAFDLTGTLRGAAELVGCLGWRAAARTPTSPRSLAWATGPPKPAK